MTGPQAADLQVPPDKDAKALVEAILERARQSRDAATIMMPTEAKANFELIAANASRLAVLLDERDAAVEGEVKLELVRGPEGTAVYLNSTRVAGPKPWGGGTVTLTRSIRRADLVSALKGGE